MKEYAVISAALLLASGCATSSRMASSDGRGSNGRITPLGDDRNWAMEASGPAASASTGKASSGEVVEIPLFREELEVGKRTVQKGGVLLRKTVQTETASQPVQLRRENISIERLSPEEARAYSDPPENAFQEREVTIELTREVPMVQKAVAVTEIVRAQKESQTEQRNISETIRREEIDIDRAMASADTEANLADAGGPAGPEQGAAAQEKLQRQERDGAEIVLRKEQLQVGKREVPAGQVTLSKNVVTEEVSRPIELRSEDIQINRLPVGSEQARVEDNAFTSQEIFIPLYEEIPVVQKDVELAEVIRARTEVETEQQTVSGQVRSEQLEVVRNDDRMDREQPATAQGGPATSESGSARAESNRSGWGENNIFNGEIIAADPQNDSITIRNNDTGQIRQFHFVDRPVLTIKEHRAPRLIDFKVGYPVEIGIGSDGQARSMIRTDTPEVK